MGEFRKAVLIISLEHMDSFITNIVGMKTWSLSLSISASTLSATYPIDNPWPMAIQISQLWLYLGKDLNNRMEDIFLSLFYTAKFAALIDGVCWTGLLWKETQGQQRYNRIRSLHQTLLNIVKHFARTYNKVGLTLGEKLFGASGIRSLLYSTVPIWCERPILSEDQDQSMSPLL